MPTLAEVRDALYEGLLSVPYHRHLGVVVEREDSGPRVLLPARPEILDAEGRQSPAAVYALADIASSLRLCDEFIPRALELDMGAVFFTVSTHFRQHRPGKGALAAAASMVDGVDSQVGRPGESRKTRLGVDASVTDEEGELVGELRFRFYVRFMDVSRIREMAPESSLIFDIHGL
jgi:hypothetical protein